MGKLTFSSYLKALYPLTEYLSLSVDDDDLGVAGTSPIAGREIREMDLGVMATDGHVPKSVRAEYEEGGDVIDGEVLKQRKEDVMRIQMLNGNLPGSEYDFVEVEEEEEIQKQNTEVDVEARELQEEEVEESVLP